MLFRSNKSDAYPDFEKLVTHRFRGLDGAERAFEMAARTKDEEGNLVIKVVVEVGEDVMARL